MSPIKVAVVGGGASGYFGAINLAESCPNAEVSIYEATSRPLTKVKISGGGRSNVTHHCFDPKLLVNHYPRGRKELLSPFYRFQARDTVEWFAKRGVELKVEADGRMFPVTDSSETVIQCLLQAAANAGVQLKKGYLVNQVKRLEKGFGIEFRKGTPESCDFLLLATGSHTKGHEIAQELGHSLADPVPSLFTFEIEDPFLVDLAGQSFPLVHAKLKCDGHKKTFEQVGPLLITHWGLSGPAILKLSAFAARELFQSHYQADLIINLIYPSTQEDTLESLLQIKEQQGQKPIASFSPLTLSKRVWKRVLEQLMIPPQTHWNQVLHRDLRRIIALLSHLPFKVKGKGVFKEEFVTCGGVKLKEVDFKTMESRLCPGLYLAGEVLDIDGITGGFNFQNAWTTSWIAAQSISQKISEKCESALTDSFG